ncbi:MAG TPA: hypothetical protein VFS62_08865 [Chloroflexota bacterium]|nr:hypothetical protein [Chloroflexota bacterium]
MNIHQGARLTRMNLLVDRDKLRELCRRLGVRSESEAVRRSAELVLLADEAEQLAARTAARGGLADVFGRTLGDRLPRDHA